MKNNVFIKVKFKFFNIDSFFFLEEGICFSDRGIVMVEMEDCFSILYLKVEV